MRDYEVGDTVEYKDILGQRTRAVVEARQPNLKHGKAEFEGLNVGTGDRVWGYDDQIENLVPSDPVLMEVPDAIDDSEQALFRIARQGQGPAGPAVVWLGADGRERAIIGFDWCEGQMRAFLYDARAIAEGSPPTRVLWLDSHANYVRSTRGDV